MFCIHSIVFCILLSDWQCVKSQDVDIFGNNQFNEIPNLIHSQSLINESPIEMNRRKLRQNLNLKNFALDLIDDAMNDANSNINANLNFNGNNSPGMYWHTSRSRSKSRVRQRRPDIYHGNDQSQLKNMLELVNPGLAATNIDLGVPYAASQIGMGMGIPGIRFAMARRNAAKVDTVDHDSNDDMTQMEISNKLLANILEEISGIRRDVEDLKDGVIKSLGTVQEPQPYYSRRK